MRTLRAVLIIGLGSCLWGAGSILKAQETAQDSLSTPTFFLSLDAYYRLASTDEESQGSPSLQHGQVSLGWITAGVEKQWGRLGGQVKLAYGSRARQFYEESSSGPISHVREAVVSLDVSDKVSIRAGVFPGFYGFEADDPQENDHYSNSWAYSLSTAGQAGVQLEGQLTESLSWMVGCYNDAFSRFLPNSGVICGGYLSYEGQAVGVMFSTLLGHTSEAQDLLLLNLVAEAAVSPRTQFGAELVYQPFRDPGSSWSAYGTLGLYCSQQLPRNFSLALRGELFHDRGGFYFLEETKVVAGTVTLTKAVENVKFFAELRLDESNRAVLGAGLGRALALLVGAGYLL